MRSVLALALALPLTGCGGAEPPPTPKARPTLGTLASAVAPVDASDPHKALLVVSQKPGLPDTDALEAALAMAALVASVGDSSAGVEVGAAGVLCEVKEGQVPADKPSTAIQPELDRHGLSHAAGQRIDAANAALRVECRPDEGESPKAVPPVAEAIGSALVAMNDGQLHDPQTGRWWPRDAWDASRSANKRFDVSRSLRVLVEKGPDGHYWMGTRGMVAFGRPDLEVFPVTPDQLERARKQLPVIADVVISSKGMGPGARMEFGPAQILMLDRAAYAATLPEGTAGVGVVTPPPTAARVALVDPAARAGDLEAHARFVRRLTIR